ncbi:MAG TPA: hypothetical protein ENJ32_01715 [Crenotrichaceae bacterium]|nr:hypothetical protein [Crenotrichaceae bacterium]
MKYFTLLVILFSANVLSSADTFSVLDVNGDNVISRHEAITLPGLTTFWRLLDVNADDQLSSTEFQEYAKPSEQVSTPEIDSHIPELSY